MANMCGAELTDVGCMSTWVEVERSQTEPLKRRCMTGKICFHHSDSVVIVDRQAVAEALKENRTLKRLNLERNAIQIEGVQAWRSHWVVGVCRGIGPEKLSLYSCL